MKKSFVAMALILVLCMSQFLIGNAEGKAIDITASLTVNDAGHYTVEDVDGGKKVTATGEKTNWSFFKFAIDENAKEYTKVRLVVEGKADTKFLIKLEGGGATNVEQWQTLTGEEQVIEWTVEAANLTETGGQMFIIFLNPEGGDKACAGEWMTIKSVKLCTPDYTEVEASTEAPTEGSTEAPTDAPTEAAGNAEDGGKFPVVPVVAVVALAAVVLVVVYAKKKKAA